MIADLAAALDPVLAESVDAWGTPGTPSPPPSLIKDLHASMQAHEPWFAPLVVYLLESKCSKWASSTVRQLLPVLRQAWIAQGQPINMTEMILSGDRLSDKHRAVTRRIGQAIDRSVMAGQAPRAHREIARLFLPEQYLESFGWRNFNDLPYSIVRLLISRSHSTADHVCPDYRELAVWLHGLQDRWLATTCASIAAAMLGEQRSDGSERYTPTTIKKTANGVLSLLRASRDERHPLGTSSVSTWLNAYMAGDYGGPPQKASRVQQARWYDIAAQAQIRLITAHPQLAKQLSPWILPPLDSTLDSAHIAAARREQQERRERQIQAFMPHVLPLHLVVESRALVFRSLHECYTQEKLHFEKGGRVPRPYAVPLPDGSATLRFRLVTVATLNQEARQQGILDRIPGRIKDRSLLADQILTEYLGAWDADGNALSLPFFVPLHEAWYDETARKALTLTGHRASDFERWGSAAPLGSLRTQCQAYAQQSRAAGRTPKVLLDMDVLCAGVAYGALYILAALEAGLRIHELQQFRVDAGYSDVVEKRFKFTVYPKGRKRSRSAPVPHDFPPELSPYVMEAMRLHEQLWPGWSTTMPERGAVLGLTEGEYLFSKDKCGMTQHALLSFARHVSLGVPIVMADGEYLVQAGHMYRYMCGRIRDQLGDSIDEIQQAFGHQTSAMTRIYLGSKVSRMATFLKPQRSLTLWEALQVNLPEDI
ncbi:site-specific integrase [Deinococcus sp. QL22]|uniref:site-specific integrase n=1 Tax=Deinococcus sp. QL22 TaxID=2939437 RepID=UPI00201803B9|nr:site-specific integrase [Deinococcus sp. QL22]UQN10216.1 site-specific integrase [Deinococcus sp. QL22]